MADGTICMAVFRPSVGLLRRQIDSIKAQSVSDWRCIIGIDGIDPAALEAVQSAVAGDSRFIVHHYPENVGFYRNFERILQGTSRDASWIALSDQDDYWYPNKLELLVNDLKGQGVALVSGQARVVRDDGNVIAVSTSRSSSPGLALWFDNQVTGSLSVFRASLLKIALPFPMSTDVAYHDHWIGVVAELSGGVSVSNSVVQDYVQHASNVLGEEQRGRLASRLDRLRRSGSLWGPGRYIAQHRWGWRVGMARTLDMRVRRDSLAVSLSSQKNLAMIGNGRLGLPLFFEAWRIIIARKAPVARSLVLLWGALWWRERYSMSDPKDVSI